ncbi:MAG TPA: HNH endonuclease [Dehalococcoidales bacterium]
MLDQIFSYREMCDEENVQTLQRGMNFRLNPRYSLILMSQRSNAPYQDRILEDGVTIEYEGHDAPRTSPGVKPKELDQPKFTRNGEFTQNGHFANAVAKYRRKNSEPELVKVYEKILPGVWSLKGYFELADCEIRNDGKRNVFVFILKLIEHQNIGDSNEANQTIFAEHSRLIPTQVKKEVWQRDKGRCVLCGSSKNLHFDHDLPFSKGGTSLTARNIRLLCAKCNLAKSDKIE